MNATKHLCLERDVQRLKHQHLRWLEIDYSKFSEFQVTTLYSINVTMAPYPIQRITGDGGEIGNASFSFTLTSNETSNLKWKEIEDIGNLAMFFNNTFSWKDCPMECVALFCARLQASMSTYVLGGESIINLI